MSDRQPLSFKMPPAWNEDGTPAYDAPPQRPLIEPPAGAAGEVLEAELVDESAQPAATASKSQTYVVPQRFGMSAILGIMTALAVMFGILQALNAHPFTYLFLGVLSLVICVVQMFFGGVPRTASVAAGAVVFALFVLSIPLVSPRVPYAAVFTLLALSLPFGGFLGYLTGTCAAGIFLIMDHLERLIQARRGVELVAPSPPGAP